MKNIVFIAGFFLLTAGCKPKVTTDQVADTDYSSYRTYAFMDSDIAADSGETPSYYSQAATQGVESTVKSELTKKGVTENTETPDMLIGYHFVVEVRTKTIPANSYVGYGPYYGWGRWGYGGWGPGWYDYGGPAYVRQAYGDGTVVIDMVDAKTHNLIWRGAVKDALRDPNLMIKRLPGEIARVMKRFPENKTS